MADEAVKRRANVAVVTAHKPGLDGRRGRRSQRTDGPLLTPETIAVFLAAFDASHDVQQAADAANVSQGKRYWLRVLLRFERGVGC